MWKVNEQRIETWQIVVVNNLVALANNLVHDP